MSAQPIFVDMSWQGDLRFAAASGQTATILDSEGQAGPSPMQALAFALVGCMAMDVVHVLRRGHHDLRSLRATLTGDRAERSPRRFVSLELLIEASGNVSRDAVDRAVALSLEKYCSVWHSMRQDIDLSVTSSVLDDVGGDGLEAPADAEEEGLS